MTTEFPNLMRLIRGHGAQCNHVTNVPWPQRSAVGICHDHPDCQADAVMAARCRGFSDACVRGVPAPVWEAEKSPEETLIEGLRLVTANAPTRWPWETDGASITVDRTGFGEYRVTLPREAP